MKITLQYKYLIHDVDQWTFRLGESRIENALIKNQAESSEVSTDISFYRRKIEDGVAHLGLHLQEELVKSQADATDTLDTTKASWVFEFKADSGITARSTDVAELMHRFVVMHVIRDWATAYSQADVASFSQMFAEAQEALDEGLYSLELPTKHRRPKRVEDTVTIVDEPTTDEDGE